MIPFKLYYEEFRQPKRKERIAISQELKSVEQELPQLTKKDTVMTTTTYSDKKQLLLTTLRPRKTASHGVLQPVKPVVSGLASLEPSVAVIPDAAKRVIKIPVTFLD